MLKTKIAMMRGVVALTTATLAPSNSATAATLTYSGALANPNSVASFFFTSDGSSNVTFKTYSYNGGTSTNGTNFGSSGFNPKLAIFGPSAALQDRYLLEIDRLPGAGDISFTTAGTLARGNYRAVISIASNLAIGPAFANGFTYDDPTATQPTFGSGRNGFYAFDISGSGVTATVPEPTSIIGTTLAGLAAIKLKRKLSASNNNKK